MNRSLSDIQMPNVLVHQLLLKISSHCLRQNSQFIGKAQLEKGVVKFVKELF